MNAIPSKAALRAGVEAVTTEAAGALEIVVVMPDDGPGLAQAVVAGDRKAMAVWNGLLQTVTHAEAMAEAGTPLLCVGCPAPLVGRAYAFVAALPMKDSPVNALGVGVCQACGPTHDAARHVAIEGFRQVWPDLRMGVVTHPTGGQA